VNQVILHIGLHKTGTKFWQHGVFPRLEGINYVQKNLYERKLFDLLLNADYLTLCDREKDALRILEGYLSPGKRTLLSDEFFSGNPFFRYINRHSLLLAIKRLLPGARIILSLRGQEAMIDSLYREYIVQGGVKRFEDFVTPTIPLHRSVMSFEPCVDPTSFRYHPYVEEIVRLFGADNVFVFPMERMASDFDSLLQEMLQFIEAKVPEGTVLKSTPRHASASNFWLEFMRRINSVYRSAMSPSGLLPLRFHIGKLLKNQAFSRVKRGEEEPFTIKFDFREDNERLDDDFHLGLREHYRKSYQLNPPE